MVKKDLLGIGKPVLPADVTLGGCPAIGEDPEAQVLVFESELHGCSSQLLVRNKSSMMTHWLILESQSILFCTSEKNKVAKVQISLNFLHI